MSRELQELKQRFQKIEQAYSEIKESAGKYMTEDEQTILKYEAAIGRNGTVLEKLNEDEQKRYAASCQEYLRYGMEVDRCIAGELSQKSAIWVGKIPPVFESVGCEKLDMFITQKHMKNILREASEKNLHHHGIEVKLIKQLPELLKDPLIIVKTQKHPDTLAAVLEAQDKEGRLLIVPITKNGQAFYENQIKQANFILSVYGKNNLKSFLEDAKKEERILYSDKNISTRLSGKPLQLRQCLSSSTYMDRIRQKEENVNIPEEKKPKITRIIQRGNKL